jgi:hypothetical protein
MNEIGNSDRTTTLILPFPVEMLQVLGGLVPRGNSTGNGSGTPGQG